MGILGGGDGGNGGNGSGNGDGLGGPGRDTPGAAGRDAGGASGEVTGLPPEWGPIVIPDDLAALAEEAERIRAELRGRHHPRWWGALPGLRDPARLPALLLAVAIVAAVAGLFTLGYGARRGPYPGAVSDPGAGTDAVPAAPSTGPRTIPALDLLDGQGRAVSLRSLLPAVILLIDGCDCAELIVATDLAAPPGAAVLLVARTPPAVPGGARDRVRALADPAGELRSLAGLPGTAERAGVLLAGRSAEVVRSVAAAESVDVFRADLQTLLAATPAPAPPDGPGQRPPDGPG